VQQIFALEVKGQRLVLGLGCAVQQGGRVRNTRQTIAYHVCTGSTSSLVFVYDLPENFI